MGARQFHDVRADHEHGLTMVTDMVQAIVRLGEPAQIIITPNPDRKDSHVRLLWGQEAFSAAGEIGEGMTDEYRPTD